MTPGRAPKGRPSSKSNLCPGSGHPSPELPNDKPPQRPHSMSTTHWMRDDRQRHPGDPTQISGESAERPSVTENSEPMQTRPEVLENLCDGRRVAKRSRLVWAPRLVLSSEGHLRPVP